MAIEAGALTSTQRRWQIDVFNTSNVSTLQNDDGLRPMELENRI
jgi:hypothetical protein